MNIKNKYIIFCVFSYQMWCPRTFVKVNHMLLWFVRISCNQRSSSLLRWVPFIEAILRVVALITLAGLGHATWRYATISFLYVFPFLKLFDGAQVIKSQVKQWLHTISSFQPNLVYNIDIIIWHNNIKNWWYKVR